MNEFHECVGHWTVHESLNTFVYVTGNRALEALGNSSAALAGMIGRYIRLQLGGVLGNDSRGVFGGPCRCVTIVGLVKEEGRSLANVELLLEGFLAT